MDNKKWKRLAITLGKLFIDLGKLAFGSMVLGTVLKGDVDLFRMFMFGAAASMLLFVIGVWFSIMSEE